MHPTLFWACNYLSMLGLSLNHVSKRGSWWLRTQPWLANVITCGLFGAKPLPEGMPIYCHIVITGNHENAFENVVYRMASRFQFIQYVYCRCQQCMEGISVYANRWIIVDKWTRLTNLRKGLWLSDKLRWLLPANSDFDLGFATDWVNATQRVIRTVLPSFVSIKTQKADSGVAKSIHCA